MKNINLSSETLNTLNGMPDNAIERYVNLVVQQSGKLPDKVKAQIRHEATVTDKQRALYDVYLVYARLNNMKPLSFDVWLNSVCIWAEQGQVDVQASSGLLTSKTYVDHLPWLAIHKKHA